jgi:opacity protein-like surface antigen
MQLVFVEDEELVVVTNRTVTSTRRNKRLQGYSVSAGFEKERMLPGREVRWGAEYRFTDFQEWNFTAGNQRLSVDPRVHDVRFRIVFPFQSLSLH